MPKELQKFTTEYGDFWIEVEAPAPSEKARTKGISDISVTQDADMLNRSSDHDFSIPLDFDGSLVGFMPMIRKLRDITRSIQLKEVEVEVGAKFTKKMNLFVISGGADVDFKIKFKWDINRDHTDDKTGSSASEPNAK